MPPSDEILSFKQSIEQQRNRLKSMSEIVAIAEAGWSLEAAGQLIEMTDQQKNSYVNKLVLLQNEIKGIVEASPSALVLIEGEVIEGGEVEGEPEVP